MKKLIPVAMLMALASASASAFFGDNVEFPLSDDNPYVNGVFAMNEYDMWDPRWYLQEAENMFSEIDNELSTNTNTKLILTLISLMLLTLNSIYVLWLTKCPVPKLYRKITQKGL